MRFLGVVVAAITLGDRQQKTRPIAKVIKLLEDMKAQLTKEQKDDEEVYDKLSCWCTTNDQEKSQAISTAEKRIAGLSSSIEEFAGAINELKTKIERVKEEYNADWEALKQATEVRMKESAAFSAEEKDLLETIGACKQALTVLSKHHPELAQVRSAARTLQNVQSRLFASVSNKDKGALTNFLHGVSQATSFLSIPGFQSYAPASGEIFGILKQMKEDFAKNLSSAQQEEEQARQAFKELKVAKEAQMAAARKQQANFEAELADNLEKKATAEEDLADTEAQLSDDQKFLLNLRQRCKTSDAEYQARVKSRHEEIEAVQDTIGILDSDNSFDQFEKSLGFAQMTNSTRRREIYKAVKLLRKFSLAEPRLGLIAVSVQLDAFEKVKKAIDDMISQLKAEAADEVEHRDWCNTQFNQNESETAAKTDERDDLQTQVDTLTSDVKTLTDEIDILNSEIGEMKTQMTRAGDNRAKENADFQEAVVDQRITQQILQKARQRMAQKYALVQDEPQAGADHTALSGTKTDPGNAPARFNEYGHNAGGARVLAMLDKVIADSKTVENEAIQDERDSQVAYEGFIQDSNQSIDEKQNSVINKTEQRSQASAAKTIAKEDHSEAMDAIKRLADYNAQLHQSCDFVLKNFTARQDAREKEVQALRQAKDILSGMQ